MLYLPRIWPFVTDMQHYYHARYPPDDWHLAYMFSLVYFSVEVRLVGVFPHSVSIRRDPCVRVCAPLTLASSLTRKQNRTWGDPALHFSQVRGHLNWRMGLPVLLGFCVFSIFPYIAQFMGCVIDRRHYGLKIVFFCRHFTAIIIHAITIYGVVCVQLAHFSLGDWKYKSIVLVIIITK